jgi:hypothetical protein
MSAAQNFISSKLCKYCKCNMCFSLEDIFYPLRTSCLNCCKYLLNLSIDRQQHQCITLLNKFVCNKCIRASERYDCKYITKVCLCAYSVNCECCKICKYTLAFEVGNNAHYESKCSRCDLYIIHMYKNYIFHKSLVELHNRAVDISV